MEWFQVAGLLSTVIAGQFALGVWLNSQFNVIRREQAVINEKFIEKLEYHERHDDRRFSNIIDSLWELRLKTELKGITLDQKERERIKSGASREEDCCGV